MIIEQDIAKQFKFYPLSFSWVALHPQPKGVIQFIGAVFVGSFPTLFYRYLLKQLYLDGYTIIALPFRFTFRHWAVAISLLREQQELRPLIVELAVKLGYDSKIYGEVASYYWVGHSLGCKYIALLELLADQSNETPQLIEKYGKRPEFQIQEIQQNIKDIDITIKNQPSLLIAPDIGDTEDAIKIPFIPKILDYFGLGVLPTKKSTFNFIKNSSLFNLTAMISFNNDKIAGNEELPSGTDNTVRTLLEILGDKLRLHKEIKGGHLRPLGIELGGNLMGPISSPPQELPSLMFNFIQHLKERISSSKNKLNNESAKLSQIIKNTPE